MSRAETWEESMPVRRSPGVPTADEVVFTRQAHRGQRQEVGGPRIQKRGRAQSPDESVKGNRRAKRKR